MKCLSSNHAFLLLLKFPTSLVFLFIGFFLNNLWHPFIFPWPLFLICFRYPDCFLICMQVQNWDESIASQGWFQECDLDLSGCACRASCRLSILNSSARDHFTMALVISIWLEIWWGSRGMIASDTSQISEYDSSWNAKVQYISHSIPDFKAWAPMCKVKDFTSKTLVWECHAPRHPLQSLDFREQLHDLLCPRDQMGGFVSSELSMDIRFDYIDVYI